LSATASSSSSDDAGGGEGAPPRPKAADEEEEEEEAGELSLSKAKTKGEDAIGSRIPQPVPASTTTVVVSSHTKCQFQ
jgi:hypothetical protein